MKTLTGHLEDDACSRKRNQLGTRDPVTGAPVVPYREAGRWKKNATASLRFYGTVPARRRLASMSAESPPSPPPSSCSSSAAPPAVTPPREGHHEGRRRRIKLLRCGQREDEAPTASTREGRTPALLCTPCVSGGGTPSCERIRAASAAALTGGGKYRDLHDDFVFVRLGPCAFFKKSMLCDITLL